MSEGRPDPTGSPAVPHHAPAWWVLGLCACISVLFELGGEPVRLALRYEKSAAWHGEYWRLLTGHFVHAGTAHLLLNVVGVGLIATLFFRDYSPRQWLMILLASVAAIDLGFVLFEPQLEWYVGLSGVLHGALAAGAVAWWQHETRRFALALTAILVGKLSWEQWQGALPLSGDMPVIVDAHLYGAFGGLVAAVLMWLMARRWPLPARSL
jgi:rhomboid family GlyGly-CTERM serine protease